ncbi:anti-sigma factor domain-containing protein [Mumia sp. DW29H23]|uniref:anti-sigma factor n=1 Tax=Mumia sp. DW29H23 TaxID=3421241 RepID=UPI003D69617F
MTEHPDLVGLLRGELTNREVLAIEAHVGTCDACKDELVTLAAGHALLTSTTRTLRRPAPVELPVPPVLSPRGRAWWRRPVALAAAAVVLLLGAVAVPSFLGDDGATRAPRQTAALEPVEGEGSGEVVMTESDNGVRMAITTENLPAIGPEDFYYAWLFDPATEKMLALGVIDPDGAATFELPADLVARYQVVDVSLERDDGDPAHSATSVLRADYGGQPQSPVRATDQG